MIENIRLSLRGIWHHKMRSFLTMLGVIIGIASILAIVSIVEGTNRKLEKSLVGAGNNVISLRISQDGWPVGDFSAGNIPYGLPVVSDGALESIRQLDHVEAVSKYYVRTWADGVYYQDNTNSNVSIYGVQPDYFETCEYQLVAGRMMTEEETKTSAKVCMVDTNLASNLFDTESPVGKILEIKEEPYTVVGVVKAVNTEETEYESINDYYMNTYSNPGELFVNYTTWPLLYIFDEPEAVAVHVDEASNMTSVGETASGVLNGYLYNSEGMSYAAVNSDDTANTLKTLTTAITAMLVSIASLSLLVGGIGVMNIMLVSVSERTSEIGLKKALGAKPRVILGQFLTESAVLTSVGGVIGVLLGIGIGKVIAVVISMEFAISVPWIFIAVGFSVGIGLLFGVLPARKAAKMNPIDALRRD